MSCRDSIFFVVCLPPTPHPFPNPLNEKKLLCCFAVKLQERFVDKETSHQHGSEHTVTIVFMVGFAHFMYGKCKWFMCAYSFTRMHLNSHSNWSDSWMSVRPNLWLLRLSTARRLETLRASPKRSMRSGVPSPWEPGSRVLVRKEMQAMRTSPTSRWSRTVCQVSGTEAKKWFIHSICPHYQSFLFCFVGTSVCLHV